MLVAVGNGPSYGGGMRVCPGAPLDDGLLDVTVARHDLASASSCGSSPGLQGHPRDAPGGRGHAGPRGAARPRPASIAYADGERVGPLPVTCERACPERPARAAHRALDRSLAGMPTPAERYAASRRAGHAPRTAARPSSADATASSSTIPGRAPARRSRTGAACWSPRPPAPARRSSASSPSTSPCAEGRKCFYTTPIKALSNQKFHDLVARLRRRQGRPAHRRHHHQRRRAGRRDDHRGAAQHALRRLAARSRGLGYVVMDEVHYLADRFRGAVWEEVIIHLPESVRLVVAVGDGQQRRGVRRLARHRARRHRRSSSRSTGRCRSGSTCWSATRLLDLFDRRTRPRRARVNPELLRLARERRRGSSARRSGRRGRQPAAAGGRAGRGRAGRAEVVERLDARGPAAGDHVHLQPGRLRRRRAAVPARRAAADRRREERAEIRAHRRGAHAPTSPTRTSPCSATGSGSTGLERGVAAHHAGHAARLQGGRRGAVRPRAGQGRVRHRDARARHQHAGPLRGAREAGEVQRRGARRPHAGGVHPAHRPGRPPRHRRRGPRGRPSGSRSSTRGASPASPRTRTYPLRSSFRPTYNMAVNLVGQFGRDAGPRVLESSFAQFQADRAVVGLARQVRSATRSRSTGYARGDDLPPRRLRRVRRAPPARSPTGRRRCRARGAATPARAGRARRWRSCGPAT